MYKLNTILGWLQKNYKTVLIVGLSVALVIFILLNNSNAKKADIAEYNVNALSDTLRTTKNELGEVQKRKLQLITDNDELKKLNSSLYEEIKKLSKSDQKNLIEINKLLFKIDFLNDSIIKINSNVIEVSKGVYKIDFNEKTQFREIGGYSTFKTTTAPDSVETHLTTDAVYADLVISKKDTPKGIEVIASSSNPYLNITSIEGALIKPEAMEKYVKQKKYNVSLFVGYGFTLKGLQPMIGVGVGRTIFKF